MNAPVMQANGRLTFEVRRPAIHTSLHIEPASAMSFENPGMTRCRKMATLLAGYIPHDKVPLASRSRKLVNCVQ